MLNLKYLRGSKYGFNHVTYPLQVQSFLTTCGKVFLCKCLDLSLLDQPLV